MQLKRMAKAWVASSLCIAPLGPRIATILSNVATDASQERALRRIRRSGSIDLNNRVVIDGPFKGLMYPKLKSVGSVLLPKLLGVYESELHSIISCLEKKREYELIIDIGAAEGYYAIGLARLFNASTVVAFEENSEGQEMCKEMAEINRCADRVKILGRCDRSDLIALATNLKQGLIFCDCEGGEVDLLLEGNSRTFSGCDIVVELHEVGPGNLSIAERFHNHFKETHNLMFINVQPFRTVPSLLRETLSNDEVSAILNERRRLSVGWCFLESKR